MSFSSISKFKVIPIKQCLDFGGDKSFLKVLRSLRNIGIKWTDLIRTESSNGYLWKFPNMDSIFFHEDRFEILIDARGFQPQDLKCKITTKSVEVFAQRQEKIISTKRNMSLSRNYQLPQYARPEGGDCCLSSEGILLVTAPWNNKPY